MYLNGTGAPKHCIQAHLRLSLATPGSEPQGHHTLRERASMARGDFLASKIAAVATNRITSVHGCQPYRFDDRVPESCAARPWVGDSNPPAPTNEASREMLSLSAADSGSSKTFPCGSETTEPRRYLRDNPSVRPAISWCNGFVECDVHVQPSSTGEYEQPRSSSGENTSQAPAAAIASTTRNLIIRLGTPYDTFFQWYHGKISVLRPSF
jgi:hypothetical protein